MGDSHQIRIIQAGSEIFAFDTIVWPKDVFEYPIVYMAEAMSDGCYDSYKVGWKWIVREQFEWLVKHCNCLVSYTGASKEMAFFCNNHQCWERYGKDYSVLQQEVEEPQYYLEPDLDEERKI